MNARETAWRLFAAELNQSVVERKGAEEKSPSYVISPLGAVVNRVMIAGVLLDKENAGTEEEPVYRARIQDVSGNTYINIGKFQPEAMASIANIGSPAFVVAVGKVRTFTLDDGRTRISVRPERILEVDESLVDLWTLEAAQSMWARISKMKAALAIPDADIEQLVANGFERAEADGIVAALNEYGFPESQKYLKTIQNALKKLLPDTEIDFGLPEDVNNLPDEIEISEKKDDNQTAEQSADKEDIVYRIIQELGSDAKGAPADEVNRRASEEGISPEEVEEISSALMEKGMVYEPSLNYLKTID